MKKQECRVVPEETNARFFAQQLKAYEFVIKYAARKIVLDIGCGDGYGAAYLSKVAKEVIAVDYEEEIVHKAQKKYVIQNVKYLSMDATNLTFDNSTFDIVTSFQVIEHIFEDRISDYLLGIKRVLKDEGEFYCTTLNLKHDMKSPLTYQKAPAHTKEYTFEEFKTLLEKYFSSVKIYELHLTLKHAFYLMLKKSGTLNFLPDSMNPVKRFYDNVTVKDFIVTPKRARNPKKAIDFYAICRK